MKFFIIFNILSSTFGFTVQKSIHLPNIPVFNKPQEHEHECQSGNVLDCSKSESDKSGLFFPNFSNLVSLITTDDSEDKPQDHKKTIQQPSFCGHSKSTQSRIVGGKEASVGQFPWLAQIWLNKGASDKFICGGSLITDNVLVTAAHCIETTTVERYKVILGRHFLKNSDESSHCCEQEMIVTKVLIHQQFNRRHLTNDIALMWLKTPYNQTVQYRENILPVCLPDGHEQSQAYYLPGTLGTVSGWGLLEETAKKGSNILQYVSLPVLAHERCDNAYGRFVDINSDVQFCAGNHDGQDACAGDSGGPFVMHRGGKYMLIGIVSYGRGCARAEYPGVYTKVYNYLEWIYDSINESEISVTSTSTTTTTTTTTSTTTTTTPTTSTTTTTTTASPVPEWKWKGPTSGEFCIEDFRALRCPKSKTIKVVSAVYAIDLNGVCKPSSSRAASIESCSLNNALLMPRHRCNGRSKCWIYHGMFHHDPCPGFRKYAKVDYECI